MTRLDAARQGTAGMALSPFTSDPTFSLLLSQLRRLERALPGDFRGPWPRKDQPCLVWMNELKMLRPIPWHQLEYDFDAMVRKYRANVSDPYQVVRPLDPPYPEFRRHIRTLYRDGGHGYNITYVALVPHPAASPYAVPPLIPLEPIAEPLAA